jgi:hypothetical protein
MKFHPYADLFPLMTKLELDALAEDIRANGQQQPVILYRGEVLDGRNRYLACAALNIMPWCEEAPAATDPLAYVLSANLHRRHLDTSQRALIGAKIKPMLEDAARERQKEGRQQGGATAGRGRPKEEDSLGANLPESNGRARDQAAAAVNVSPRSVESAVVVLSNGTPDLARMVEAGEVSVSAAAAVASLPKPEQRAIVAEGPEAVRARAREIREALPPMPTAPSEEEHCARRAEGWERFMHRLYVTTNSVRDEGGIAEVASDWPQASRDAVASELNQIVERMKGWINYLLRGNNG